MPYSASRPRIWFPSCVREPIIRLRIRCNACRSCCSMDLLGMKRMFGRLTDSQIASASFASFFCDFRYGLTLGSHQSHVVPKGSQHTPPVMRTPRSFHADQTGRQPLEEVGYLRSSQPPTKNGLSPGIHSVHLEHIFRRIESNYTHRDSHGTLLPRW